MTLAGADVTNLTLTLAGGQIEARGLVPFDDSPARVNASWRQIDAAALTTMLAGRVAVIPDGLMSGEVEASGPFANLTQWNSFARVRLAGGATRRGRLAAPGATTLGRTMGAGRSTRATTWAGSRRSRWSRAGGWRRRRSDVQPWRER